jgi:hypothetical protein
VFDSTTLAPVTVAPPDPVTTAPTTPTTPTSGGATAPVDGWTADAAWQNATGNLAGMASECGNLTMVAANPASDQVLAGVALHGLWQLSDDGSSWVQLGQAAGSEQIDNRPSTVVWDPVNLSTFWESGFYHNVGVYRTDDNGQTFRHLGDAVHTESLGIDFTDPLRSTMLIATHESLRLHVSTDGGQQWTDISTSVPAGNLGQARAVVVVDENTFLFGTSAAVLRSTDRGATWTTVLDGGVTGAPTTLDDGSLLWLVANGGAVRSSDGGATWTSTGGSGVSGTPILLPDGSVAALRGGFVMISSDLGASWRALGSSLSFEPTSLAYSPARQMFFASHFDCRDTVAPDAIASLAVTSP